MARKKIPTKVMQHITEYVALLKEDKLPIDSVILFGSYAKDKQTKWSDVDLCIVSSQFKDTWKTLQYLWAKRIYDNGITIEPVGFSKKDFKEKSSLIEDIKKNGIQISF